MTKPFRVVTWNCHGAKSASKLWDYFTELDPDIALLQDVRGMPENILSEYSSDSEHPIRQNDLPQSFMTVVLVKGRIENKILLPAPEEWMAKELKRFEGNLVARQLFPDNEPMINAISVYNPHWCIDNARISMNDLSEIMLPTATNVWAADILWASLKYMQLDTNGLWIIGGDFNISETFDAWKVGKRSNEEYFKRMEALGLLECLRKSQGKLTPTYRNTSQGNPILHQIDHMFVTQVLADKLVDCFTGTLERVFDTGISDHLPIIADFSL